MTDTRPDFLFGRQPHIAAVHEFPPAPQGHSGWLGGKSEIRNPKSEISPGWLGGIPNSEFRLPNLAKGWA